MTKLTEANALKWPVFNLLRKNMDGDDWFLFTAPGMLFVLLTFFIVGATTDGLFLSTGYAMLLGLSVGLALWPLIASMGRLHVLSGMSEHSHSLHSEKTGEYLGYFSPYEVGENYLKLDKQERALYPKNFLDTLKNKEISERDMGQVLWEANKLNQQIHRRRQAQAECSRRNIDVSPVLEQLQASRQGVTIDAETYEEYSESI